MEVTIQSTLGDGASGRLTVATDPTQTVDSLIAAFCIDKNIQQKSEYALKSKDDNILHVSRTLGTCGINSGDVLYLTSAESLASRIRCNQWWVLAAVCLMIGGTGITIISIVKVQGDSPITEYAVVLDAGSTHTSAFVYSWPALKNNGTGEVTQVSTSGRDHTKCPSLSSYGDNPKQAGTALKPCVDTYIAPHIPEASYHKTRVFLGATAGMRLLDEVDHNASEQIFQSVRSMIADYHFLLENPTKQIRIISGREEGTYAWVTVNHLKNSFRVNKNSKWQDLMSFFDGSTQETLGAMDMGGASTQLSFVPAHPDQLPRNYTSDIVIYGEKYDLYSNSFLCYGKVEAERQMRAVLVEEMNGTMVLNPCGPLGKSTTYSYADVFEAPCTKGPHALRAWGRESTLSKSTWNKNTTFRFVGTSNSTACARQVTKLFNFTSCSWPHHSCSFNGKYIPHLNGQYLAFSTFFYVVDFLNLTKNNKEGTFSLPQFEYAIKDFCSKNWTQMKDIPIAPEYADQLELYCFDAHYVHTILTKGYNFTKENWHTISFKGDVNGKTIGWALGFMLNATNSISSEPNTPAFSLGVFIALVILFIIFLAIAIGFACFAHETRGSGNQYKRMTEYGSV
ncbi:ectonucleoside triphosphate diphosphohydrolase 8 [Lingula anatina]|uniref:Ectonucleoside triphosphate diphosphohydrolase 8 n=1 Tax=Lingula anatina TaxID=7574 RepID=A0A1S3K9T7_LINAN|nr:ectonucleoside triphosphate diphosphohydrolase 8 [Lingula anatina]|eukprot:XP_013419262.1 ectonucleoside triphosphate diphosphohydrolase 8 [Lingula anatina]